MSSELEEKMGIISYKYANLLSKYNLIRDEYLKLRDVSVALRDSLVTANQTNKKNEDKISDLLENVNLYKKKNFLLNESSKKQNKKSADFHGHNTEENTLLFDDPFEKLNEILKERVNRLSDENKRFRQRIEEIGIEMNQKLEIEQKKNEQIQRNIKVMILDGLAVNTFGIAPEESNKSSFSGLSSCAFTPANIPHQVFHRLEHSLYSFLKYYLTSHEEFVSRIWKMLEEQSFITGPLPIHKCYPVVCDFFNTSNQLLDQFYSLDNEWRRNRFRLLYQIANHVNKALGIFLNSMISLIFLGMDCKNLGTIYVSSTLKIENHIVHSMMTLYFFTEIVVKFANSLFQSTQGVNNCPDMVENIFSSFQTSVTEKIIIGINQMKNEITMSPSSSKNEAKEANLSKSGPLFSRDYEFVVNLIQIGILQHIDAIRGSYTQILSWLNLEKKIKRSIGFGICTLVTSEHYSRKDSVTQKSIFHSRFSHVIKRCFDNYDEGIKEFSDESLPNNTSVLSKLHPTNSDELNKIAQILNQANKKNKELTIANEQLTLELYTQKLFHKVDKPELPNVPDQNETSPTEPFDIKSEILQPMQLFVNDRLDEYLERTMMAESKFKSVNTEMECALKRLKDKESLLAMYQNEVSIMKNEIESLQKQSESSRVIYENKITELNKRLCSSSSRTSKL